MRHAQEVVIELAPGGEGTRLTFAYTFGERALATDMGAGWHDCIDALEAVAEGREPAVDHAALRAMYGAWFDDATAPEPA